MQMEIPLTGRSEYKKRSLSRGFLRCVLAAVPRRDRPRRLSFLFLQRDSCVPFEDVPDEEKVRTNWEGSRQTGMKQVRVNRRRDGK